MNDLAIISARATRQRLAAGIDDIAAERAIAESCAIDAAIDLAVTEAQIWAYRLAVQDDDEPLAQAIAELESSLARKRYLAKVLAMPVTDLDIEAEVTFELDRLRKIAQEEAAFLAGQYQGDPDDLESSLRAQAADQRAEGLAKVLRAHDPGPQKAASNGAKKKKAKKP